jgi:hypothetical protein
MRDNISSADRGNKILAAILIAANVIMLVIGILTIPPNLRSADRKRTSCAGDGANKTRHTVAEGRNPARDHGKRQYSCAGGNRRELIHGGTPRFGGLSLVHGGRGL